jgi:hypothetical protein
MIASRNAAQVRKLPAVWRPRRFHPLPHRTRTNHFSHNDQLILHVALSHKSQRPHVHSFFRLFPRTNTCRAIGVLIQRTWAHARVPSCGSSSTGKGVRRSTIRAVRATATTLTRSNSARRDAIPCNATSACIHKTRVRAPTSLTDTGTTLTSIAVYHSSMADVEAMVTTLAMCQSVRTNVFDRLPPHPLLLDSLQLLDHAAHRNQDVMHLVSNRTTVQDVSVAFVHQLCCKLQLHLHGLNLHQRLSSQHHLDQ